MLVPRTPPFRVRLPEPSCKPSSLARSTPPLMVVVPVYVLVPVRVSVPVPDLVRSRLFSLGLGPPSVPPKMVSMLMLAVKVADVLAVEAPFTIEPPRPVLESPATC